MSPHELKLKQAYSSGYEKRGISAEYYIPMIYERPREIRDEFNRGWKKRSSEIREGS